MDRFLVVLMIAQALVPSLGQQISNGVASTLSSQATQGYTSLSNTNDSSSIINSPPSDRVHIYFQIFIPFCHKEAVQSCAFIPVKDCKYCSMVAAGFFAFFVVLLGLGLLFGNALVIYIFAKDKSTFTGTYGKIKVSLAVSDMMAGLLFFGVILPSFVETLNQTSYEIFLKFQNSIGTPPASVAGFFHIFIFTASFYHLVLLAQQRLYAVAFPLRYREQSPITVGFDIALVWFISFLVAGAPLWHRGRGMRFAYYCATFFYTGVGEEQYMRIQFSFMAIVPYILMLLFAVATGICLYCRELGSRRRKRENMIFFTLVLMVLGLTITTGPFMLVVFLSWNGYAHLPSFQIAFVTCVYLALANSIVNVLVYSVVDEKFRSSSRQLLRKLFGLKPEPRRGGSSSFVSSTEQMSLHRTSSAIKS